MATLLVRRESERVCERVSGSVCVRVFVCVRERERTHLDGLVGDGDVTGPERERVCVGDSVCEREECEDTPRQPCW